MVVDAVRKSDVLIEALPYIKAFHNRIIVIKLGGSAQDDEDVLKKIFADIDFMISVGMRPVVVHGGGKSITAAMKSLGTEAQWVHGQRVTDAATMDVVSRVLIDEVGQNLCGLMKEAGRSAAPLNGRDHRFLRAIKKTLPEYPDADLGFVGEPVAIDGVLVDRALEEGQVPMIAPVACGCGHDAAQLYNINGDTASALIAADLHAEKLVFFTDTAGIYMDKDDPESRISHLCADQIPEHMKNGVIQGGMIPKVEASLFALKAGVHKAHIVPAKQDHALLLEIFTRQGIGTEIVL